MKYFIWADVIGTAINEEINRKTGKKMPVKRAYIRIESVKNVAGQDVVEIETRSAKSDIDLNPGYQMLEIEPIPVVTDERKAKLFFRVIGVRDEE